MKTRLGFLTEEGRTRSKNAFRRSCAYAVVMFVIAGAGGYGIYHYWVSADLTTLQRVYFKQYVKSSYRSYLRNSRSHYTTLARTVTDPHTKKDVTVPMMDDQIEPVFDDNGRIAFDERHYPKLLIRPEVERKKFFWAETIYPDAKAYEWYRGAIYEGKTIPDIWRPAWLGAIVIFIFGTIGLTTLDMIAQRLYLKGEPIRGTRELSPKKYAREHRKEVGYGILVFAIGGS